MQLIVGIGGLIRGLKTREFFRQLVGFMDEDRQALRTNVKLIPLELYSQQRSILFRCIAIEAC